MKFSFHYLGSDFPVAFPSGIPIGKIKEVAGETGACSDFPTLSHFPSIAWEIGREIEKKGEIVWEMKGGRVRIIIKINKEMVQIILKYY